MASLLAQLVYGLVNPFAGRAVPWWVAYALGALSFGVLVMIGFYVGGMGARGKNFYNDICKAYGYEQEAVEIQDLYLDGKKQEAAAKIPADWLLNSHLVGPKSFIKERLVAFKEAGVTVLQVNPIGPDAVQQVELLRSLMDDVK